MISVSFYSACHSAYITQLSSHLAQGAEGKVAFRTDASVITVLQEEGDKMPNNVGWQDFWRAAQSEGKAFRIFMHEVAR